MISNYYVSLYHMILLWYLIIMWVYVTWFCYHASLYHMILLPCRSISHDSGHICCVIDSSISSIWTEWWSRQTATISRYKPGMLSFIAACYTNSCVIKASELFVKTCIDLQILDLKSLNGLLKIFWRFQHLARLINMFWRWQNWKPWHAWNSSVNQGNILFIIFGISWCWQQIW